MASSQEQSTKVMEVTVRSQGCNDRTKHLRITMGLQPSTSDPQKHDLIVTLVDVTDHSFRFSSRLCQEDFPRTKHLRITMGHQPSTSDPQKHVNLLVTLADDTDRSFLFACRLCQEDFPSLKERYGLHAQFGSFPEALMKAFGKCGSKQSSSESRYELVLSSDSPSLDGSAELSLMKTDEFASGTILSLPFTRAKVEEVKEEYVGDLVTLLQAETERLQVQLAKTQEDLEQVQTRLEERIQHQSVVQRTVMRQHHQLTSTVGVRLEHVLDCLRLPSHETSWVRRMVLTLKRRFTAVHSRQKTELRLLFQEQ
ncbi:spindle assembly abnormal protein 6 homolog [Stigmatopora argus]